MLVTGKDLYPPLSKPSGSIPNIPEGSDSDYDSEEDVVHELGSSNVAIVMAKKQAAA